MYLCTLCYILQIPLSMSSLPNDFLYTVEMDDSVISLSSDSVSSTSSTSLTDNILTINEVVK